MEDRFISDLSQKYLNPSAELAYLIPVFNKVTHKIENGFFTYKKSHTLHEASPMLSSMHILVVDERDVVVSSRFRYPLQEVKDFNFILVDSEERAVIEKEVKRWGFKTPVNVALAHKVFTPVYQLRDIPLDVDWDTFISSVISYQAKKDFRLQLLFKALLLRGFKMCYSPHAIISTNGGTGKSSFLGRVGRKYEKLSPNHIAGFATGSDDIHQGAVHNQIYALTIEQIESQLFTNFFSFLLSFMEEGRGITGTGGVDVVMEGTCPIVITANPIGYDLNSTESFRILIDKLSDNQIGLGRRLGFITFGMDFLKVEKTGSYDELVWKNYFEFYRAVEERTAYLINDAVYNNDVFLKWLETPIKGYDISLLNTFQITDTEVKEFLEAHLEQGYRHLKGGALAISLVDNMKSLLEVAQLDSTVLPQDIQAKLLKDADVNVEMLTKINIGSFGNMTTMLQKDEKMEQQFYNTMPSHLKECMLMIKNYKNHTKFAEMNTEVILKKLETFMDRKYFVDYDKLEDALDQDRYEVWKSVFRNHFGFYIRKDRETGNYIIVFTDIRKEITVKD